MGKPGTAVLVYQAGIANVFKVDRPTLLPDGPAGPRNAVRMLQHAFAPCQWYARGLLAAGWDVVTAFCNRAGDVASADWSDDRDAQPFAEQLAIVGAVLGQAPAGEPSPAVRPTTTLADLAREVGGVFPIDLSAITGLMERADEVLKDKGGRDYAGPLTENEVIALLGFDRE